MNPQSMSISKLCTYLAEHGGAVPETDELKNELYEVCYALVSKALPHFGYLTDGDDYEMQYTFMAEEMYFRTISGTPVQYWYSYFRQSYVSWWVKFCKLDCRPQINVENYHEYYDPYKMLRYTKPDTNIILDKLNTAQMLHTLFEDLNKHVRYCKHWSSKVSSLNAHMSLMLSIKYGHFVNFRLSGKDLAICRFIYNKYKQTAHTIISASDTGILSEDEYVKLFAAEIFANNTIESEEESEFI